MQVGFGGIGEALVRAATLHSYTISNASKNIISHESLFGNRPDNSRRRNFVFTAYMYMEKEERISKLAHHAQLGV